MNYKMIAHILGIILLGLCILFFLCMGVGYCQNPQIEGLFFWKWIKIIYLFFTTGLFFLHFSKNEKLIITRKEGICIVGLGWLLISLLSAIPYYFLLKKCSYVDAFFESCSGLTTTGATVFSQFIDWPYSLIFWRSFTQWVGGLGFLIVFLAIFSFLGSGTKILYENESSGRADQINAYTIKSGVLHIIFWYIAFSLLNTVCNIIGGLSLFDALCLMFGTLSTGGLSAGNTNFIGLNDPFLEGVAIAFMFIGGSSFCLLSRSYKAFFNNIELRTYAGITLISIITLSYFLYSKSIYPSFLKSFRFTIFQVVSFQTTCGFASYNYDVWPLFAKLWLILLMIIGGCTGSTAAGFRVFRVLIVIKMLYIHLEKMFRPQVVRPLIIGEEIISKEMQSSCMHYIVLWFFIWFLAMIGLAFFDSNISLLGNLSGVTMALSNAGCAFGEFGPCFSNTLSTPSKYLFGVLMLLGRLEFYALLVLCMPSLWKQYK